MINEQAAVMAAINDEEMIELLTELVNTPSPTGNEEAAARVVADFLARFNVPAEVHVFAPNRANVVARLKGTGGGPTLMLNGHLDTSYRGDEPELDGPGYKNNAVVVDEWMYGNGVHNMKSAVAAFAEILVAVSRSRTRLKGDIVLVGVAGEIERAPYGRFRGSEYLGFGVGTAYALQNGLDADMCILGEPTTCTIGLSNLGVLWIRLRVRGTTAHTQHASAAINAISRARILMDALDKWMIDYRTRYKYNGLRPAADITALEGGWPYRLSRVPIFCDTFLCLRIPPSTTPDLVVTELKAEVAALESKVGSIEVDVYVSRPAAAIDENEPVVTSLHKAHAQVLGSEPEYRPRGAYMDSSYLVANGIPTVVYGPSGRVKIADRGAGWAPDAGEHTSLKDLRQYVRVVASAAVDICSPSEKTPSRS